MPQQLFTRRQLARQPTWAAGPVFLPTIVEAAEPGASVPVKTRRRARRRPNADGIVLEIFGVEVRIGTGAATQVIEAVIPAFQDGS